MNKFAAPVVLLVLACALLAYLFVDCSGTRATFDADAYLKARSGIDSLEMALWNAQGDPEAQVAIRSELDTKWQELSAMRVGSKAVDQSNGAEPTAEGLSQDTVKWIVGGAAVVVICIVVLVLILRRRQEIITRRMEAIKAERFKAPKDGFDDAATLVPRPRPQKVSIIADAEEYAAKKRETMVVSHSATKIHNEDQNIAFEDENGIPENKIITGSPDSKPTLRPTAKERITSAVQNLSDVFHSPRGVSRDHTMKIRAQSRNATGDPNLTGSNPLDTTRFDRETVEKSRIMQLARRGFPASAIASQLRIAQDKVESVIRESQV
ncbi:MAG: hypothetical protein HUK20_04170 [Fibrobacter sp.]|nr:hypothetical protein [Fibrobacter sp.]